MRKSETFRDFCVMNFFSFKGVNLCYSQLSLKDHTSVFASFWSVITIHVFTLLLNIFIFICDLDFFLMYS